MNFSPCQIQVRLSLVGKCTSAILYLSLVVALVSLIMIRAAGIRINTTDSMPRGIYLVRASSRPVKRGDTIAICPPIRAALFGRERGYLGAGRCPGKVEPLLKTVAGVFGDVIRSNPNGVTVNGRLLPRSMPLRNDADGRPLPYWSFATYVIPAGMIWLYAPSERSWDSRYWGPVPIKNVVGTALPILTN